jgi:hypothetical protein
MGIWAILKPAGKHGSGFLTKQKEFPDFLRNVQVEAQMPAR